MKNEPIITLDRGKKNSAEWLLRRWPIAILSVMLLLMACNEDDQDQSSIEKAEMIYTDPEPDFVSAGDNKPFALDLNQDGITDFTIGLRNTDDKEAALAIWSDPEAGNAILSDSDDWPLWIDEDYVAYAMALENRNIIGEDRNRIGTYLKAAVFYTENCDGCQYSWMDKEERYLGLKFNINGTTHFGWVRMQIISKTEWVIRDFAWNATPGMYVYAGQMD